MTIEIYRRDRNSPQNDDRSPVTSGGPAKVYLRRLDPATGTLGPQEGLILDLGPDDHVVLEVIEARPAPPVAIGIAAPDAEPPRRRGKRA